MLRRHHQERRAEDRVGARGEHADVHRRRNHLAAQPAAADRCAPRELHQILHPKRQFGTLRLADPVALRRLGALRPVERVEVVEQPPRVIGDPEEPLLQEPLLHQRAAPLARAVDHLLVGQHGLVVRTPVHGRLLLVRQPALVQLQEQPLRPLVVRRVGRGQLVAPVDHQARPAQLAPEVGDVAWDQLQRMHPDLEGVVLRVDAERVVAQWLEHGVAAHALVAAVNVVAGEREQVPDVQPLSRRIGEHHERVVRIRA